MVAISLAEFEKAYGTDPASDIAMQEIKRTREMIQRNSKAEGNPGAALRGTQQEEEKTLTPSELAHKRAQERTDSLLPIPELRPLNTDLIDLKMNNQRPRIMFETVAKIARNVRYVKTLKPEYQLTRCCVIQ